MPLTLECPLRARERILTMGVQGTGKSYAPLTIARLSPRSTFHVIANDYSDSYEVGLDTEFTDLDNVIVHNVDPESWNDFMGKLDEVRVEVGPDDWMVVDSVTPTWQSVQSAFIERIFEKGVDEYFLEVREKKQAKREKTERAKEKGENAKDSKSLGALEGWMDWPVINKMYAPMYGKLTSIRGHLYMTAEQASLGDDDDKEVRKLFGPYGVKPAGQKRLGFVPRTVVLLTKSRVGEYAMTTIKDRHRTELEDVEFENFAIEYLVDVAGWKKKLVRSSA